MKKKILASITWPAIAGTRWTHNKWKLQLRPVTVHINVSPLGNFFIFLSLFSITNYTYEIGARKRAATTKNLKGPNDAKCHVWALGTVFLSAFLFTNVFLDLHYPTLPHFPSLHPRMPGTGPKRRICRHSGPNDTGHVVWAKGKFFFSFFVFLHY